MPLGCARCGASNPEVARYCRHCGLLLCDADGGQPVAGRAQHPQPLPPPAGFEPVAAAKDLYFHAAPAGGGRPLLGTEPLVLRVFNGGYDLERVVLHVRGLDKAGSTLFGTHRDIEELARGQTREVEIPSWELPDPMHGLTACFVSAEFTWQSGPRTDP